MLWDVSKTYREKNFTWTYPVLLTLYNEVRFKEVSMWVL